jgi:hypothetical protein
MIKVVKHGHAPYQMTCKYCECVFIFADSDIQNNHCQWDYEVFIYCPECKYQNIIHSRGDYQTSKIVI